MPVSTGALVLAATLLAGACSPVSIAVDNRDAETYLLRIVDGRHRAWVVPPQSTGVGPIDDGTGDRFVIVTTLDCSMCPTQGDSGSPVYQNRSDGKVTAFGIMSGSLPLAVSCHMYFTDIRDAYSGLPGTLKTG